MAMRTLRAIACACIMAAAPASIVHAQTPNVPGKEHAKRLFEEGVELEKKSDYAAALAKYKQAEQITATPGLRFHKGYCLEMTGKLAAALEEYEVADKMARDANKQDVRAAVTARLEPLRTRVPQIAIRLATPAKDAEVQLDGALVGAPLLDGKGFRVDPGEHTVTARAGGYKPFTRKIEVPESQTTTVDVTLDPATAAAPAPVAPIAAGAGAAVSAPIAPGAGDESVTEPPSERPRSRSLTLPIAATGGAMVFAGLGVVTFLVAGGAQNDANRDCPTKPSCDDERSRVRLLDTVALASFIGAAGLGVLAVVLWTSKGPARSAARVTATPSAVGLEGTF
jgi:hypothetical protein